MNDNDIYVIGYQCIELVAGKKKGEQKEMPLGRRFNVKAAAEQMAELAKKQGRTVYVREGHGTSVTPSRGNRAQRQASSMKLQLPKKHRPILKRQSVSARKVRAWLNFMRLAKQ